MEQQDPNRQIKEIGFEDPDVSRIAYPPLSGQQIRLIRMEPLGLDMTLPSVKLHVEVHDLKDQPSYRALSCPWGTATEWKYIMVMSDA